MNTYIETTLENWNQIFQLDKHFIAPFYFRGQKDSSWPLETSIERECRRIKNYAYRYENDERWMIHEFKRKYHLYSEQKPPNEEDKFEWLAIMQHYGAPTRLLDFSESIFIAAYFAIKNKEKGVIPTIWAVNWQKLRNNIYEKNKLPYTMGINLKDDINHLHIELANTFIAKNFDSEFKASRMVIPLEPKNCNARLAKQQGLFLMHTSSDASFMENLQNAFGREDSIFERITFSELQVISLNLAENAKKKREGKPIRHEDLEIEVLKINLKYTTNEIEESLKKMNITAENLFPGLEGLAQSLIHTKITAPL